jgi:UDP-N-acetylglucosamine 2-epimerase (non-hydrolysing)
MQMQMPLVFPVHPRTQNQFARFGLEEHFRGMKNLHLLPPIGYIDFLKLMMHARLVVTDSGGIQEETTALGIPCITMRNNTERPVTVRVGTNEVVGQSAAGVLDAVRRILAGQWKAGSRPELWDGHASSRIADILIQQHR